MEKQLLIAEWKKVGIREGDTILIHSDLKRTFRNYLKKGIKITSQDVLESFLEAVGSSGTVLFPLFNFDFPKGIAFDIRSTPSQMGSLTEAARRHPFAVRTGHPIYSFAVIGFAAEQFRGVDNFSGYGSDSPFAMLHSMNGKIAVLDIPDIRSMTFYHYVEEMNKADYRYHKKFTGYYTDESGKTSLKTYGLFVRNIEQGVFPANIDNIGELMWKNRLYSGCKPNEGCGLRIASARDVFNFISDIIRSGRAENFIYRIIKNV